MRFLFHLPIALLIFGIGIALTTTASDSSDNTHYYFLSGAVGAQVWLAVAAIRLRSKRLPRFDMIVASELIIALGILSLICGIIVSVVFTSQNIDTTHGISFGMIWIALIIYSLSIARPMQRRSTRFSEIHQDF